MQIEYKVGLSYYQLGGVRMGSHVSRICNKMSLALTVRIFNKNSRGHNLWKHKLQHPVSFNLLVLILNFFVKLFGYLAIYRLQE